MNVVALYRLYNSFISDSHFYSSTKLNEEAARCSASISTAVHHSETTGSSAGAVRLMLSYSRGFNRHVENCVFDHRCFLTTTIQSTDNKPAGKLVFIAVTERKPVPPAL